MQQAQFISLSLEELSALMESASERGAAKALAKQQPEADQWLSTNEAMKYTGYSTHPYFRAFCKKHRISPVGKRCRVNYYLLSDLKNAGKHAPLIKK